VVQVPDEVKRRFVNTDWIAPPWLQDAWIRRLRWHYDFYNYYYADHKLRPPVFLIDGSRERLGLWNGLHRTISISEHHVLSHPWESVLDTLRHEMAHQYVEEVLRLPGASPHGEPFARACKLFRVEPRATASGLPLLKDSALSVEREKMLERVRELLAMAGSPNEHEAATAMRLANKYLLKYNLSLSEAKEKTSFGVRTLGRCTSRIQEYEHTLARILQDHFFVEAVWVFSYDSLADRPGRILEVSGTPENLEMAEYVHRYILNVAEPLWREHRRRVGGGSRLQYLAGLIRGFEEKLESQKVQLREEHGLVWLGDPLLDQFHRYMHPRLRKMGSSGVHRGSGFAAGLRDGKEITLRRGVGGSSLNRGRLIE
jgi:hypothetical protein